MVDPSQEKQSRLLRSLVFQMARNYVDDGSEKPTDPSQFERQRSVMRVQVNALVRKYGGNIHNPLRLLPKAEAMYRAAINRYDSPREAREFVIRAVAMQLKGAPATYQDISDSRVALGDQSDVPDGSNIPR